MQLIAPLNGFFNKQPASRGDFSWNMYSQNYNCDRRYVLLTPDGKGLMIELEEFFAAEKGVQLVCYEDRLPAFHDWLCEELKRRGQAGTLKAGIVARYNYQGSKTLVERYTDLCTIEGEP